MADEVGTAAVRSDLERLARQLAGEALEEAADRARGILVERLTEMLVAEAERSLTARQVPAAPTATELEAALPSQGPPEPEAAGEEESGCYVFAIAQAGGSPLPSLQGMDGSEPVHEVASGRLAGVVCQIPLSLFAGLDQEPVGPESRLAALAQRHDQVVRATFERRALLPLRFGTVLTSERQLVDVLEEQQAQLLAELGRLEGRAEWTCRIQPDAAAATTTRRPQPELVGGAAYLAERERALAATEEADPYGVAAAADRVSEAVEAHVESALPPDPAGEEARISFLVADQEQEPFAGAVAAVAEAAPALRIELLGPHPPYHFASVQLGSDGR